MVMKKIQYVLVASAVLSSAVLFAGTYTWNGGAAGNWSDTGNWLCDGAPASALPGDSDKVDLAGTKATIVLTENVAVGYFWAFQEGSEITVRSGTAGAQYALSVKKSWDGALGGWGGGFPGKMTAGRKLVLDGVCLFPNYESNAASQWGLGDNIVQFREEGTIEVSNGALYFGKLGAWNTLHLVAHASSIWVRSYDGVSGLDVLLEDSEWSGFQQAVAVNGDATFTFAGSKPLLKNVGTATPNPNVSGTLTFRYVLPVAPYAKAPVVNDASVDFAPAGSFAIEIDPGSPGLTSGAVQVYRLMAYEKDAGKGLNLTKARYPTMRTSEEKFTTSFMTGASASGLPQYLDLTVDGSYDPDSKPLDITFNLPMPSAEGEVFSGTVSELGSAATIATVKVKYGTNDSMDNESTLGTVTEPGPFAFTLGGLDPSETYRYQLVVTTDAGGETRSEAGTFSLVCGSVLADKVDLRLDNGQGTIGGSLDVVGTGTTTVRLLVGRSGDDMAEAGSVETTTGDFSFDYTFVDDGNWFVKFVCSNAYGDRSWSDAESVTPFPVTVADSNVYTLKDGADGDWTDASSWSCAASGSGLGRPTSHSEVVFPAEASAVVRLSGEVSVARLTILSAGSHVTVKGKQTGSLLLAPSIVSAKGAGAELTLDGVKLTDNANFWNIGWKFEPGADSTLKLRNGARIEAKQINPQADSVTIDVAGGSEAVFRESWNGNTHSFKVVLDDSTFEVPDHILLVSEFVFKGTTPVAKVQGLADMPVKLTYYLPETPYADAPFQQSTMLGNRMNLAQGQVTVSIPCDSPVRINRGRGDYPLIRWDSSNGGADYGIDTDILAATEGLKASDAPLWSWREGVDQALVGPQYLTLSVRQSGLVVILR